jgi:putative DNA primase/helicase
MSQFSAQFIAKGLEKSQRSGKGWRCCCPAHPDKEPSFDIEDGDKGPIFICRAGCSQTAIIKALRDKGLWWDETAKLKKRGAKISGDQPKARPTAKPKVAPRRVPVACYPYTNAVGELVYQVVRYEPKDFRQRRPDGEDRWIYNLDGITPLPYRLPELLRAIERGDRIFAVEGERDVDNLAEIGITATCNAGGAGKFPAALIEHFRGAKLTVIPDNDAPGRKHCRVVGTALADVVASLDVIELAGLPAKGDVSDWLAAGGTVDKLRELAVRPWSEWLVKQPVHKETDQEIIARLALLSPIELDRVLDEEAKALGCKPATLKSEIAKARGRSTGVAADADDVDDFLVDPEPWPEPVDLADLLDGIVEEAKAHLVLPPGAAEVIALWVVFSHAHNAFHISPYLVATSPTPECGKSTLLTFLRGLVPKPCAASNFTTSTIFRIIEAWQPTLLIDEADTFLRDNNEMRGVLNGAHLRSTAYAARVIDAGNDHKPKMFPTWGPKFIALIGRLPATLESRSIHIEMRRKTAGETVRPLRADRIDHLTPLCRQAARWWSDNAIRLGAIDPEIPKELYGRAADNWRPLLAIAEAAGDGWLERARQIAVKLGGRRDEQTSSIMLLEDIKAIFVEHSLDRISTADLIDKLTAMDHRPWVEFHRGKQITPRQIAKLLDQFNIRPGNIRIGTATPKGYQLEQFHDAFARYTGNLSATSPQPSKTGDFGPISSATRPDDVAHENGQKPRNSAACGGMADDKAVDRQDGQGGPMIIPDGGRPHGLRE